MPTIMNAIAVIMSNIWGHTPPRVTDPVPTVPVLVRTAAAATAMVRGSSIRPVSIGAQVLAETAAQQTMTTLRTV